MSSNIKETREEVRGLKRELAELSPDIRELNRGFTTYLALARRAGLPEDIIDALARMQQLRISIEMAYRSLMMFYAASGPFGALIGLGGLAVSAFTLADLATELDL